MIMIPLAPTAASLTVAEPDATRNPIALAEHERSGPLPVGFEFERAGSRYNRFELASDGFIRFDEEASDGATDCLPLELHWRSRLGEGRLAYEVRGVEPRRRLVVSFAERGMRRATLMLIVYERTGIVEMRRAPDQSFGDPTMRQLDIAQPLVSRVNSARKIG